MVLCKHLPSTVAQANCRWCLPWIFIPHNRPCSLIASSHQLPGCETMIPSLGSPCSPLVDPPPLRIPPLKWRWRLVDWIPDTLHRWCKSRPSSVEFDSELLRSPVEWRSLKYLVSVVALLGDKRHASIFEGVILNLCSRGVCCTFSFSACVGWVSGCKTTDFLTCWRSKCNSFWLAQSPSMKIQVGDSLPPVTLKKNYHMSSIFNLQL